MPNCDLNYILLILFALMCYFDFVFQAISRDIESKAMILDAVQTQSDTLLRDLGPQEKQTVVTQLESLVQKHKDLTVKAGDKQTTLAKVSSKLIVCLYVLIE